jgi:hypothetical protein
MNPNRKNSTPQGDLIMKAVIFCDDSAFAAKASSALQHIGHRPVVAVEWIIQNWPAVILSHADMAEKALLEGMEAHLIVIPARYGRALPLHLHDWLEQWAALRQIEDAAVAVIGDDRNTGLAKSVDPELTLLVQKHGLNLITDEAFVAEDAAKLIKHLSVEHEQPLSTRLSRLSYATTSDSFRDFGINE